MTATEKKPRKRRETVARKPGRPKAVTPDMQDRLLTLVTEGCTVTEACKAVKVGYSTVGRKEAEDPNFGRLLARARTAGAARLLDAADIAIRSAKTHEQVARARELAVHRRWVASKLIPQYADRPGAAVQVNVGQQSEPVREEMVLETARNMGWILAQADQIRRDRIALPALPAPASIGSAAEDSSATLHRDKFSPYASTHNATPPQSEEPEPEAPPVEDAGKALSERAEQLAQRGGSGRPSVVTPMPRRTWRRP